MQEEKIFKTLVVDDNSIDLAIMLEKIKSDAKKYNTSMGREAVVCRGETDPRKIQEIICENQDACNLLITDKRMPKMNGLELTCWVKNWALHNGERIFVIVMSGDADPEKAADEAFDHGADYFLSKPFDSDRLTAILEELVLDFFE